MNYYRIARTYTDRPDEPPIYNFRAGEGEVAAYLRSLAAQVEEIAPVSIVISRISEDEYAHRGLIEGRQ